jgi:hypothetical protein
MGTLADASRMKEIRHRIEKLTPDSKRKWGKMTVQQMVPHITDQFRMAMGEMEVADKSNFFTRTFLKWLLLSGMPIPKGKAETAPELNQEKGQGTLPTDFSSDVSTFHSTLDQFCSQPHNYTWSRHPLFGKMSGKQWKKLGYNHLNHHLNQFGV